MEAGEHPAAVVFLLSTLGLVFLVEPIPTWYYHLAWWSYIVGADGVNRRLTGRSLLVDRPWHFAWLAGVSAAWWTVFELIDVRLGNWYYVMCLPSRALRWTAGLLAFASVLPGIVETLALVETSGRLRSVRVRPLVAHRPHQLGVELAQVAQLAPEQEPLDRCEPRSLGGAGGVTGRFAGLRLGERGLDLLLLECRERLLPLDPRLLEPPQELGRREPVVLG